MKLLHATIALFSVCMITTTGQAQSAKQDDITAIKSMIGCFDVTFQYTETFAPEIDYEKAYDYTSSAHEWAEVVEESDNKIVIQHLLIINDSTVIKHWRQDWIYEADGSFRYDRDNQWVFEPLDLQETKGKWTQKVYQVDDSPRYSGTATWVHVDGRSEWYNKADSPLPRREFSKRSDYNVMKRGNRIQITSDGWLHEQDNDKIIRTDTSDVLLVQEKGYNHYYKRPDEECKAAQTWWSEHKELWAGVREIWDEVFEKHPQLHLAVEVDDKKMYEHLFYNQGEWTVAKVHDLIDTYIIASH